MAVSELAMNALSGALKLEQDGYGFYVKAAERVQDETVKQTMLSLAEDEKIHEAMIARQMQALREEGGFVVVPGVTATATDLSQRLFPPDPAAIKGKVGDLSGELEAIQMALEVESSSYDYYRQTSLVTEDVEGQAMYRWLASAELTHFNILMSNYEAINQRITWA
ncbi:MAG: ferritin family protein [Anaerolineae bacterium]